MWIVLSAIIGIISLIYIYIVWNNDYWKKLGVPHEKPKFFFGNFKEVLSGSKHFALLFTDIYKKFPNALYAGFYKLRTPAIIVRDPELLKTMLVKDFVHFAVNDMQIDPDVDPIFATNIFSQTGEEWKKNRSIWTASLTPNKIRNSFDKINEKCNVMINYLKEHIKNNPNEPLDPREVTLNFFTDAVVSSVFGLQIDSFKIKDNPFKNVLKSFFIPSFWEGLKTTCIILAPGLSNFLRFRFVSKHAENELKKFAKQVLENRQITGFQKSNSFDSILLHNGNKNKEALTDIDVAGLILGFLIDGTETSSGVSGFLLYSIAANPNVQRKLHTEVDEAVQNNDGKLEYETIHNLQYLDMVISETLRLYPPGLSLHRLCTKDYILPPAYPEGKEVRIPKGMTMVIPIYGLHMDPKYFPNPEVFDPERFSEENKKDIKKFTYLPFGEGPRVCIGNRFAINQTKIGIANIMRHFEIRLDPKMEGKPIKVDPNVLIYRAIGDLWITFHSRIEHR